MKSLSTPFVPGDVLLLGSQVKIGNFVYQAGKFFVGDEELSPSETYVWGESPPEDAPPNKNECRETYKRKNKRLRVTGMLPRKVGTVPVFVSSKECRCESKFDDNGRGTLILRDARRELRIVVDEKGGTIKTFETGFLLDMDDEEEDEERSSTESVYTQVEEEEEI